MITRQTATGRSPVSFPDSAEFELPLKTSVIPLAGFGSVTYTRATPATVIDHDGVMRSCISGEVRFTGARRVQNLASYSEDAGNAYWTKSRVTVTSNSVVDPSGNLVADTIVGDGAGSSYFYKGFSFVSGNKYIISACFKVANSSTVSITSFTQTGTCSFDLSGGTAGTPSGIASAPSIQSLGNGWYRCSVLLTANATGTNNVGFVNVNYLGDICYICRMQCEDVTGQSIQTVGEYVSTNVLPSPFHGAMVDGVKYFDTTLTGTQLTPKGYHSEGASTNLFTQSNTFSSWTKNFAGMTVTANQGTGPDGANSLWKVVTGVGSALQSLTLTTTVTAAVHTYTVYAKAGENGYLQLLTSGAISNGYVNFDLFTGTIGASSLWTGSIEAVEGFPGIYRCIAKTNTLVATSNLIHISQVPTKTTGRAGNMTGDGVSGLYIFGAQFELGLVATTYIPTTGATVTRNDDIISFNVNNFNNKYGGVYAEVFTDWTGTVTSNVLQSPRIFGSSGGNLLYLGGTNALTNNDGGTTVSGMDITAGSTVQKVGLTYSATRNFFANGASNTGNSYDGDMSITSLLIANTSGGTRALYGNMRNVKIWKTPPTDAEMVAITS